MVDTSVISIGSRLISISLGLVTLFLLFEIKSKVIERLKITFIYFIIADICMITLRMFGIMDELGIWVSTFYDSALVIFSLFLFLSILDFYKFTSGVTRQIERNISEPERVSRVKPQTSMISANRLKEMEEKISRVENRIREGSMRTGEAEKMSRRFKLQLASLNEAYEKGYISQNAYERGKERIKGVAQSLKKKTL